VGIMLNPSARGKGYAKEALRLTFEFAFEVAGLDVVTTETKVENDAFKGLMKNFDIEGVEGKDDKGNDTILWTLKKEAWEAGKGRPRG
jgi:RimJ/RimL family protein N-acetyltransferase